MLFERISDIPIDLKGKVGIKLHMGERGNGPPIDPEDIRILFEKIRKSGGEPFLIDTTVLYKSERYTMEGYMKIAKENGYGEFPVVIADDSKYDEMNGIKVSREILDADALIILSHATGHILTGFGGSIKNIGMGCATKDGKKQIHDTTIPRYEGTKCKSCGICIEQCPRDLISFDEDKKIVIDYTHCAGCSRCVKNCPTGALWQPEKGVESSFRAFCSSAKGIVSSFPKENIIFINVLKNITPMCDCSGTPGKPVCKDIGYLVEDNPLKADQKSVELILKENPEPFDVKVWKVFEEQARKYF
jgi:uncharacterized Fe-S center protein